MSHRPRLVVYGHAGFDVDARAGAVSRRVGGAAYYASRAANAAGCDVHLVSAIGSDFPDECLAGLDSSRSLRCAGPSAVFHQTYDADENVIDFEAHLNVCESLAPEQISLAPEMPQAVLLTTAPAHQQSRALAYLGRNRYTGLVAIDTTLAYVCDFELLLARYAPSINLVFLNDQEYSALTRSTLPKARLIVKHGPRGASMLEAGFWRTAPAVPASKVFSTTGAGDVLAGSFLAKFLDGTTTESALAFAVRCATTFVELGPDAWTTGAPGSPGASA